MEEMGIVHHRNTPFWPRANGEVERQNRSLLKAMRVFQAEGKDWRLELNKFLLAYQSTSHTTTGDSPAELFFKRKLTTKLPEFTEGGEGQVGVALQQVRDRDPKKKQQAKHYADTKYHVKDRPIAVGDAVLLERRRENKLSPSCESQPYDEAVRCGDQVVLKSPQGVEFKRLHLQEWVSLQRPWLIMCFTEHLRLCFHGGTCFESWTPFTLVLFRLNIL